MSILQRALELMGGGIPESALSRIDELAGGADQTEDADVQMNFPSGQGGYLVPAGTTLGSILDDQYGLGLPPIFATGRGVVMSRELAATYAAVYRCVTLLSGVMAGLIVGGIRVVDRNGSTVDTPRTRALIDLLKDSPNNETPAYSWWEDLCTDYMLDGNGLAYVHRLGGRVEGLRLLRPWDAYATETEHGPVYSAHPDDERGAQIKAPFTDIIHTRWARLSSRGAVRRHFALAPISVLSRAIGTGIEADTYVHDFFSRADGGAKGKIAVVYPDTIQTEQREQIVQSLARYSDGREPLVLMGDPKITQISDKPQDADALKLREFQVAEIGRVYGVPSPLLGVNVTQWGAGIEQLSRLLYRYGAKQHLARLLSAMSLRLLPAGMRFTVDETQLLRGDMTEMGALFGQLLGGPNGPAVISVEEARDLLGFDKDLVPEQPDFTGGDDGDRNQSDTAPETEKDEDDGDEDGEPEDES